MVKDRFHYIFIDSSLTGVDLSVVHETWVSTLTTHRSTNLYTKGLKALYNPLDCTRYIPNSQVTDIPLTERQRPKDDHLSTFFRFFSLPLETGPNDRGLPFLNGLSSHYVSVCTWAWTHVLCVPRWVLPTRPQWQMAEETLKSLQHSCSLEFKRLPCGTLQPSSFRITVNKRKHSTSAQLSELLSIKGSIAHLLRYKWFNFFGFYVPFPTAMVVCQDRVSKYIMPQVCCELESRTQDNRGDSPATVKS